MNHIKYTFSFLAVFVSFFSLPLLAQNLPNTLWKVIYASSEEKVDDQPNCKKEFVIDNDKSTFWQTDFMTNKEFSPHELQIDLGVKASISGVTLVPRQRNSSGKCKIGRAHV